MDSVQLVFSFTLRDARFTVAHIAAGLSKSHGDLQIAYLARETESVGTARRHFGMARMSGQKCPVKTVIRSSCRSQLLGTWLQFSSLGACLSTITGISNTLRVELTRPLLQS